MDEIQHCVARTAFIISHPSRIQDARIYTRIALASTRKATQSRRRPLLHVNELKLVLTREGVTALQIARLETALKPGRALARSAVRERLGNDIAARPLLQIIISHSAGRV